MTLRTFKGGIHPPEEKEFTEGLPFEKMPSPKTIILPLTQHLGKQSVPQIKKGSLVTSGMLLAKEDGFISAPIHSPVSGTVTSIGKEANSSGFPKDAIVINVSPESNGLAEGFPPLNFDTVMPEEIRERVKAAGIVGQGGAAFPTFVKLTPPKDKKIDVVILNGCECEPYLTRDYRFMMERPDAVAGGLKLIMKALDVQYGAIGIENNKPEAISVIEKVASAQKDITIYTLKTKYPQGAEKMLIKAVTGKELAPGKLPLEAGVVIQNIGTAVAVYDAVVNGFPLITAAVTVTGRGIKQPRNLIIPIGTPITDVLNFCGGVTDKANRVIVGGPMMGFAQHDLNAPVMKATSGIVVLEKDETETEEETPCLRCGKCVDVCPVNLLPTRLVRLIQAGRYEEAQGLGVMVCMECGTCAFTCPANIPLVQWLRLGKKNSKPVI